MKHVEQSTVGAITPRQLADRIAKGDTLNIIDVREPFEWQIAKIPGARLIPMREVSAHIDELSAIPETILYCHGGVRSLRVAEQLAGAGMSGLLNLEGGIDAWSRDIDPTVPRY